jgi:CHASE3 domain sensor protein
MVAAPPPEQQNSIGSKIGMGFVLVMCLFLFVIWRHMVVTDQSREEFHNLRDRGEIRKESAYNIQRLVLEARQAEAKFLLTQDWDQVDQVNSTVTQISSLVDKIDDNGASNTTNSQHIKKWMMVYQKQFQAIALAWKKRGLDHESGLQGQFRNSAHKMVAMAKAIANHQPEVGVVLERDVLMLRRREKDYLLRGDDKYVRTAQEEIKALDELIGNTTIDSKEIQQFRLSLTDYQNNFLALVAQNRVIVKHTVEMPGVTHEFFAEGHFIKI